MGWHQILNQFVALHPNRITIDQPTKNTENPRHSSRPDPVAWLREQLESIEGLLAATSLEPGGIPASGVDALREAAPLILATVEHGLAEVAASGAGLAPDDTDGFVRESWLWVADAAKTRSSGRRSEADRAVLEI